MSNLEKELGWGNEDLTEDGVAEESPIVYRITKDDQGLYGVMEVLPEDEADYHIDDFQEPLNFEDPELIINDDGVLEFQTQEAAIQYLHDNVDPGDIDPDFVTTDASLLD